jgi:hypothetical protein
MHGPAAFVEGEESADKIIKKAQDSKRLAHCLLGKYALDFT